MVDDPGDRRSARDLLISAVGDDADPADAAVSLVDAGKRSVRPVGQRRPAGPGTRRAVAEALDAHGRDEGAALIVVGSRGQSAAGKILLAAQPWRQHITPTAP